jgi:hypothetical protein
MFASLCLAGSALAGPPHVVFVSPNGQGPASDSQLSVQTEIGSTSAVSYHLEYGTSSSLGSATPEKSPAQVPNEPGHYVDVETITGLAPDTKYYVRAVATNADGSANSEPPQEFSTIGRLVITTGQAGPFTFDGERDILKFSASGVVNGGGRTGNGGIQVSRYPDLRDDGSLSGCDPGPIEDGQIRRSTDRSDHHFTHPCTLSVPPAAQNQDVTVYMRATFSTSDSGDPCTRESAGDPYRCVGQTVTFQVPASTFTDAPPPPEQVRSAVLAALNPTGAAAKIGSILQKGFSAAKLNAPSAGRAAIVWKFAPAGASGAASAVVARGSKTISKAGKTLVKVRLTARGKALLRAAKRKKTTVRVRATGSFTPEGGDKVTKTKLVRLRN